MRSKIFLFILFLLANSFCKAQDSVVVLDTSMFDKDWQVIAITGFDGWIYKQGNDTNWAKKGIDTAGWKKFNPFRLTIKNVDKNGRVEGWFRTKFKLDSSFENLSLRIASQQWAATDIFIDGKHVASFGSTGLYGKPYEEHSGVFETSYNLNLPCNEEHILAFHVVEYPSPFKPSILKTQTVDYGFAPLIVFTRPEGQAFAVHFFQELYVFFTTLTIACATLTILFWFLYFQNHREKVLLFISLYMTFFSLNLWSGTIRFYLPQVSFFTEQLFGLYINSFFGGLSYGTALLALFKILNKKLSVLSWIFITILLTAPSLVFLFYNPTQSDMPFVVSYDMLLFIVSGYLVVFSWKKLKGAQWSVVAGVIATFIFSVAGALKYTFNWNISGALLLSLQDLSFPFSLMIYVAMRFKEILKDVQKNAQQVLQLSEEKKEQAIKQQKILEEEVARQTIELRTSLQELKSTQAQLIQAEKMASLGELTAGIAHEIQNPLNFVNNFSEVNKELAEELKTELLANNKEEAISIAYIILDNEEKINHHGKRADAIVKSMLQHSRQSSGQKESTDINALCDEYLRLAYHGLRAKEKDFNATIETNFDEGIGKINVVPQDIGRMLLNLYNNAFYAVNEKSRQSTVNSRQPLLNVYKPVVSVSTKKIHARPNDLVGRDKVEIRVSDNGNGILQNIVDKIFQPFFTTKPTGEGTGLGLSLSYDIIKAHGGEIKLETRDGEGSTFIIQLPIT